jgi:hypothetical protein
MKNRESSSIPLKGKKPVSWELRMFVNVLEREKVGLMGIERALQCSWKGKCRSRGNRESSSIPLKKKKSVSRELRMLVDALEEDKIDLMGIEKARRCD